MNARAADHAAPEPQAAGGLQWHLGDAKPLANVIGLREGYGEAPER